LAIALLFMAASLVSAAEETPEDLPPGPGREETFYTCTACHGAALIKSQGLNRAAWDDLLTFMTERHGMPALEGAERSRILDYLASAFPPRRRQPANPFLKP
jgi:mono/diheme cytochrome c family protein